MCEESATAENLRAATPHPVPGSAVDSITLKPVDEVVVTTLVDNVYDALRVRDFALMAQGPHLLITWLARRSSRREGAIASR